MGLTAILSVAWRLRGVIAAFLVVLALWSTWHWFQGVLAERAALRTVVKQEQAINQENARAMKELKLDLAFERLAYQQTLKKAAERQAASDKLIREMRDVPGANDPAGPFWDEYARRLRGEGGH